MFYERFSLATPLFPTIFTASSHLILLLSYIPSVSPTIPSLPFSSHPFFPQPEVIVTFRAGPSHSFTLLSPNSNPNNHFISPLTFEMQLLHLAAIVATLLARSTAFPTPNRAPPLFPRDAEPEAKNKFTLPPPSGIQQRGNKFRLPPLDPSIQQRDAEASNKFCLPPHENEKRAEDKAGKKAPAP